MIGFIKKRFLTRKLGYRSGQEGIMSRFIREGDGWNSHLDKSKKFIIDALYQLQPKTVRILGSGWLLDVPMDELLAVCETIVLVDVEHPAQILHKYEQNSKVLFETTDLNNLNSYLLNTPIKELSYFSIKNEIEKASIPQYTEDLVISLNLLSQLNDYPVSFLTKQIKLSSEQSNSLSLQIQANHLKSLPHQKSVLITDYEEEYYDEDDAFLGAAPTVFTNIPLGSDRKEWDWRFDSHFIYREDCRTTLKVMAIRL